MTRRRSSPARTARAQDEGGPVVGSLCTGYGGLDLGVLAAFGGGRIAWVADPDPHIAQILDARMRGITNLGDLRCIDWGAVEPVEVVVAGFPCQDISAAGKRAGIEKGARSGLWTDIVAGLRLLRPALVVLENVAALRWRGGGLHRVLGDLAEAGYDALWRSVRAADIGAPHRRERVFLLAWRRDLVRAPAHSGRDQSQRRRGPRDLVAATRTPPRSRDQRQRDGDAAVQRGAPAADPDRLGREELHPHHPRRWAVAAGGGPTAAHPAGLGHRDGRTTSGCRVPSPAVPASAPARDVGRAAADAAGDRRDEGLPGTARIQGRPDAALGRDPGAQSTRAHGNRRLDRGHLVAVPENASGTRAPSAAVNWGVYEAAICRWNAALGRPAPHPTQPGNHGRPVLAPAFVEHLMGLPPGWVTDLPLPRTAQLRALGNGVVPQQAAHAVSLLLNDLAEHLAGEYPARSGLEVNAA